MEDSERMREMKAEGFYCSQILIKLGLELQGKENPDLVRAMQSLAGGLGFSGELCGALTGGACLLGLYAGKGLPADETDPRLDFMIEDLMKWFRQEYGALYGGIRCMDILNDSRTNQVSRCPMIVAGTYQRIKELLVENGFDLAGVEE
jgi:C_GCAxxG_C_C family probable redox protein